MSNNKINLISQVKANIKKNKLKPINPILDEHRNDIVAVHKIGFTWEQTAQQVNEAFNLKGKERLNTRSIVSLVKKWESLHWIDLLKVEDIVKELKDEVEKVDTVKPATTAERSTPPNPAVVIQKPQTNTNYPPNNSSNSNSTGNNTNATGNNINPTVASPSVSSVVDTYKTVQEFILDAVQLSNPKLHAKDLIEDTFHAFKDKPKAEMLKGLEVVFNKRTNRQ